MQMLPVTRCFIWLILCSVNWPLVSMANDEIFDSFRDPAPEMRPFARWWWNGSRVNADETVRQLDVMREAGIMGVEINTIGMPDYLKDTDLSSHPALEWLGADWTKVVLETVAAARQRDMTADIIVGSGWPFGGEFLLPGEQTQRVRLAKLELEGPMIYKTTLEAIWKQSFLWGFNKNRHRELRTPTELDLKFLRLVAEDHGRNGFNPGRELAAQQGASGEIVVQVPKGRHVLYFGLHETGFTEVKRGAPGADGPVVDHFNGEAVLRYLNKMSDTFERTSGRRMGDLFRATFVDSLELDHANWTTDLPEQFIQRRGYSIDPYLPFILDIEQEGQPLFTEFQDVVQRARYDFVRTLIELFEERFLGTYVDWAASNGLQARIQAYGREMHPLHGSMVATLPEGESWLWLNRDDDRRIWAQSTVVNKYVSSGAHLSGKRLVSFEAMTNAVPVFRATLNDFKRGMDLSLLDGLNHPILHGFNYFPRGTEYPGWVQFGSYLNEINPFWPYFRKFSDYVGRIGTLLRNSDYQAQIAVLSPRGEEWARDYMLYQPFPEVYEPWYQYALPQALQKVGFGVDHISERVLQGAAFDQRGMNFAGRAYPVILVQDVGSIEVATARALLEFHKSGGMLVFVGNRPSRSHGLHEHAQRDAMVRELMAEISGKSVMHVVAPQKDVDVLIPGPRGKHLDDSLLIHYAGQILAFSSIQLPVSINNPDPHVSQIHHRLDDGRDVFFFSNRDEQKERLLDLQFAAKDSIPVIWDPASGMRHRLQFQQGNRLNLPVEAMGSRIVVMEKPGTAMALPVDELHGIEYQSREIEFQKPWHLEFHAAADGRKFTRIFDRLSDLSLRRDDPQVKSFGGTVIYTNVFNIDSGSLPSARAWIDVGDANGTVSLSINGVDAGTSWYGHHRFEVSDYLRSGTNSLELTVSTVLANDLKSRSEQGGQKRWAWWYNEIPMGLEGPVRLLW